MGRHSGPGAAGLEPSPTPGSRSLRAGEPRHRRRAGAAARHQVPRAARQRCELPAPNSILQSAVNVLMGLRGKEFILLTFFCCFPFS